MNYMPEIDLIYALNLAIRHKEELLKYNGPMADKFNNVTRNEIYHLKRLRPILKAAPEMLEMLKQILPIAKEHEDFLDSTPIEILIAKAEGRP